MYKIEAIVMTNNHEAFVLSERPKITFERHGKFLFGLDEYGVFADCYGYERPTKYAKAFGGREFEIPMNDGTVTKASGQWWHGASHAFTKTLGCNIISATARDIKSLKDCYVFCGLHAVEEELIILRKTYTGKIYEYWEYEALLTGKTFMWDKDPKNPKNLLGEKT